MSTFGDRLKEERERLRLNQPAFGELGGVRKQAQLHYEGNKRSPDADYLAAIAAAGVDVAYVLTGKRASNVANTPTEVALLDNYRHSALDVQIGVSKLLAQTGGAVERSESMRYLPAPGGLMTGMQSDAVHSVDPNSPE
ncbi:Phage repressor [Methylomonas fluvii]|nr:Phage repressor [Methylomonas fluvii]